MFHEINNFSNDEERMKYFIDMFDEYFPDELIGVIRVTLPGPDEKGIEITDGEILSIKNSNEVIKNTSSGRTLIFG